MTKLQLLEEKRVEYINQLVELRVWSLYNEDVETTQAIKELEDTLDSLDLKINTLRNE
tara:strand:- start:2518 stop:2691 length:174 start_codon:yes stop_codon:yes gene_type:complete